MVLGTEVIDASSSVFLLGVTFTVHARLVSGKARVHRQWIVFFQLHQLRRVRRSLDSKAASTRIHSFVSSRVDYCNCLMVEAPKKWAKKLQRVMNAAARILTQMKKYDRG